MVLRTRAEILRSINQTLNTLSPQLRIDSAKGPFFYLAGEAVAQPLADANANVERVAQLSTLQFPSVATDQEALALARAFGLTLGSGSFARGIAYVFTTRPPSGSGLVRHRPGRHVLNGSHRGPGLRLVGEPVSDGRELGCLLQLRDAPLRGPCARPGGLSGRSRQHRGPHPHDHRWGRRRLHRRHQLGGVHWGHRSPDHRRPLPARSAAPPWSRRLLPWRLAVARPERRRPAHLGRSAHVLHRVPHLFYRLPDSQAVDVWVYNIIQDTLTTDTFTATLGQTQFILTQKPAVYLASGQVNGVPVTATLVYDDSLAYGRSTQESSYVSLAVPAALNDIVDITYGYDAVLDNIQSEIDGYLQADTGALFATNVLVRYARTTPVTVTITGTVLGTFDPTTVENEVSAAVGNYIANGLSGSPILGGVRSPQDLRDYIRSTVPGISGLSIPVFCRKVVTPLVEVIDIPRNSRITFEDAEDLVVTFT